MSDLGHHGEWLSLLDVSGPFLAEPVLKEALPQGLDGLDPVVKKDVRQAYDEWREALDFEDKDFPKLHRAWISFVLERVLGYRAGFILAGEKVTTEFRLVVPENGAVLLPDAVVTDGKVGGRSFLLVKSYDANVVLDEALSAESWAASPIERMVELCRAAGVRLGLVTNGERWTLVDAPVGAVVSVASWYARLWSQEPLTLQAFADLLGIRRFFGGTDAELATLLDKSLTLQDEVTDALGEQVRRAVEVLVQSLDRADQDRNRELLKDVSPDELYEAGLTIMMRIVFLLSAEERGLLLLGDRQYEANYAVSTLRGQLGQEADEVLERRWDAWSRLLSLFRAVFAGVDHNIMRMPALGGSLFDPDRFPFLEGRSKGSNWKTEAAVPLPIDNRTVLLLLEAVQLYQGRTLSYLALDVEQIGYVYEGLLERTVIRAEEVTLDLTATKSAKAPWISLSELDDAMAIGGDAIADLLKEKTGSSASRIRNDLSKKPDEAEFGKLLAACDGDVVLRDRIKPYFHLLRTDSWGYPLVYPKGTFMVASGSDRRETGTHYTPKAFTEAIVKSTLEPLVYVGPSDGARREDWRLRRPDDLLELKVCDPAMGSGAFLVQVCRYLSERLVEAWAEAEKAGKTVSADGEVKDKIGSLELLSESADERSLAARRLIAERCLYGVDMNPLAVELAKLSIWLVTLAKNRPFGFLDHNLRCGDSLLGTHSLDQLRYLEIDPNTKASKKLFASRIDMAIQEAMQLRKDLRSRPIRDITDVEVMAGLDERAREKLRTIDLVADALIGRYFAAKGRKIDVTHLSIDVGEALNGALEKSHALSNQAIHDLSIDVPQGKRVRQPFHWAIEYPEVFDEARGGFDALVGNPPFMGDKLISKTFGATYKEFLAHNLTLDGAATVDVVVFFFLRAYQLLRPTGKFGLLARRSLAEGKNREIGLEKLLAAGATIYRALTNLPWPGKASVIVHEVHISKGVWSGPIVLNLENVENISSFLDSAGSTTPTRMHDNEGLMFIGTYLNGEGFKIDENVAKKLLASSDRYSDVVFPFVGGQEVNTDPNYEATTWVINFWDWPEAKAKKYESAFLILENNVKPERTRLKPDGSYQLRKPLPQRWWHHGEKRPALYHAIGRGSVFLEHPDGWDEATDQLKRVLVISRGATKYPAFVFLKNKFIYSEKLCVLADDRFSTFGLLSSDFHTVWAWNQKTSIGADLQSLSYTQAIFETFPGPENFFRSPEISVGLIGEQYCELRQSIMSKSNKGLTKFYNDFHDASIRSPEFVEIRNLRVKLNLAVADRYGWGDLNLECGFHEVGYLPHGNNTRFTISENARKEVLSRLARLNERRAETQITVSTHSRHKAKSSRKNEDAGDLFSAARTALPGRKAVKTRR